MEEERTRTVIYSGSIIVHHVSSGYKMSKFEQNDTVDSKHQRCSYIVCGWSWLWRQSEKSWFDHRCFMRIIPYLTFTCIQKCLMMHLSCILLDLEINEIYLKQIEIKWIWRRKKTDSFDERGSKYAISLMWIKIDSNVKVNQGS